MILALAFLLAAAEPSVQTDGEAWNEGVEYYRAGDVTNALRVLRPLLLSRTHGARAAEVVAKLEFEKGDLEEAASAAQIALRAAPDDPKANRNFTRATDRLPAVREEEHLKAVLKAAEGKDPGALLLAATKDCRALMAESGTYRTNRAEKAVALADALSKRAERLADAWIPVRELIAQSVTNEEQAATISAQIEAARKKTKESAQKLGDLDPEAYPLLSDLVAQSNAWMDVDAFNGRGWQQEALDYTRAFRAKFPAWAKAYEQQAQSDTNKPPFTAEDQAKISALATELEKLQIECVDKLLPPSQERAVEIINEIRELLPKDNSGGGQSQQQQQKNDQQQNQQQQNQNQQQDQQNQQDQQQDENDSQDDQDDQQKDDQEGDEGEDSPEDQEVEAVLKKAQERSDEHEAEKKARMRKAPLPPNERDW